MIGFIAYPGRAGIITDDEAYHSLINRVFGPDPTPVIFSWGIACPVYVNVRYLFGHEGDEPEIRATDLPYNRAFGNCHHCDHRGGLVHIFGPALILGGARTTPRSLYIAEIEWLQGIWGKPLP